MAATPDDDRPTRRSDRPAHRSDHGGRGDAGRRGDAGVRGDAGRPGHHSVPAADADLGDLVMRLARSLRRRGSEALAAWDLAPHHARALRVVAHHDRIRPGELAAHLRVAPRSVTDVVDALEERGLVERGPDPTDRRATVVTLTEAGSRLVEEIGRARRADADALFGALPTADREALRRILVRLEESEASDA